VVITNTIFNLKIETCKFEFSIYKFRENLTKGIQYELRFLH